MLPPAGALVGQQFEYVVNVSNPSAVPATEVVVTDNLPDGITYVSSEPAAQASGQVLTWSLGSVDGGATKSVRIQVKATQTGTFENCAEVKAAMNLASRCCATTRVSSPKLMIEKRCTEAVQICEPIEYVIVVRNAGDGPATGVKMQDNLPEGLATSDGKTSVSADIGELKPGDGKQVRFTVMASKTGKFENKATVTADGGLTAEAVCTTTVTQPVLEVTKKGPEKAVVAGRSYTYEITVANKGDGTARETVLTDPLPDGTAFVSATEGGAFADGKVTWRLGTIEPGDSKKVSLTIKATRMGTVKNTASATAVCAEGSASTQTEMRGVAGILIQLQDDPDPIEVGATTLYTIDVTNQGMIDDSNVQIEVTLPPEEEFVSAEGVTEARAEGKTIKFGAVPRLTPKQKVTWKVVIKGTAAADVRFKVTLTSDMLERPVYREESTHIYE